MIESLNELADQKPRRIGLRVAIACCCVTTDAVLVYLCAHRTGRIWPSVSSILNTPLLPGYFVVARLAAWRIPTFILRAIALAGDAAFYSWFACGMPRDTWRASNLNRSTKTLDI